MADINVNPYFNSSPFPNSYFQHQQQYSPEKLLYDSLLSEKYSKYGIPSIYYTTTYTNSDYNSIFGEDIDVNIVRSFDIMTFMELPLENAVFSKFGIEGLDSPTAFCSITAFTKASEYILSGTEYISAFAPVVPKAGDYLKTKYSPVIYKVVSAKTKIDQFLQAEHTYELILKVAQDEHMTVDPTLSGDSIATLQDIQDIFNISGAIDAEKGSVLYDDSGETRSGDEFGGW